MFVKLTVLKIVDGKDVTNTSQGDIVYINAEYIVRVQLGQRNTEVYLSNGAVLSVKEDRDDIANTLSYLVV